MTLPCDSSRSVFPDNKVGKFTTMLAREVVLDGKYEVGLSELVMPVAQRPTKFHQVMAYTEADLLFKAWTVDMRKATFAEDIHSLDVPLGVDKMPVFCFSVNKKATLIISPGCTAYIEEKSALELARVFGFLVGVEASLESLTRRRFHSIRVKSFSLFKYVATWWSTASWVTRWCRAFEHYQSYPERKELTC